MKVTIAALLLLASVAASEDKGTAAASQPVVLSLTHPRHAAGQYKVGEPVALECKSWETGAWGPGPVCRETGKPLSFAYGLDSFLRCGLEASCFAAPRAPEQAGELTRSFPGG